jgi:hypothetical protein
MERTQRLQSAAECAAFAERLEICQESLRMARDNYYMAVTTSRSWALMHPYRSLGRWLSRRRSSS